VARSIKDLNSRFTQDIDQFLRSNPLERRAQLRDARVAEERAINGRVLLDIRVWISFLPILLSLQLVVANLDVTVWPLIWLVVGLAVVLLAGTAMALLTYRSRGVAEKVWRQTLEDLIDAPRSGRASDRVRPRRSAIGAS
jgi:hypothetical protein